MSGGRVLHTGALLSLAEGSIFMGALMRWAVEENITLAVPTGALAEAWAKAGDDHYRISVLLALDVTAAVPMTTQAATTVGDLLARKASQDVVAGHTVALSAEHGWRIITDEPTRLLALDANAEVDIVP